jgi:hypothetical protein
VTSKQKIGHLVGCVTLGAQVMVFSLGLLQEYAGILHWLPNMNGWRIIMGSIYFAGAGSIYAGIKRSPWWFTATAIELFLLYSFHV